MDTEPSGFTNFQNEWGIYFKQEVAATLKGYGDLTLYIPVQDLVSALYQTESDRSTTSPVLNLSTERM